MKFKLRQIGVLRGITAGYYATQAILLPLLPIYFAEKGYNAQDIGLFMMIGPFVTVFAQPFWGYISDKFQKLRLIIISLWLLTIASSVVLFAVDSFTPTLLFVLLCYFFMLPSTPLLDSIILKTSLEVKASYGSVRLWGSIGFAIIATISGFALDTFGGISNIKYMYWTVWLIPFSLIFLMKDVKSDQKSKLTMQSLKSMLDNKRFIWFLLLVFLLSVPHRMNDALFGLYLQHHDAEPWMVSLAWALAAISEVPTFALLSRYINRFHELGLIAVVGTLFTVRWIVTAFIEDPWILMLMQLTHSMTFAPFWIVAVHYSVRLVPEQFRSTGQSMLSAVFLGLAGLTGGFLGGRIGDVWGDSAMYISGSVLSAAATAAFFLTHIYYRRRGVDG